MLARSKDLLMCIFKPQPTYLGKENPHPKHVTWEDYEMDGRHRPGFYNLYLPERADNAGRKRYEMNITNNTITLQIDDVTYETVETDPHWGIEMKFKKHYTPSRNGRLILYLCNELVDLNREITVTANGEQVFKGTAMIFRRWQ